MNKIRIFPLQKYNYFIQISLKSLAWQIWKAITGNKENSFPACQNKANEPKILRFVWQIGLISSFSSGKYICICTEIYVQIYFREQ